jgi:hypothetical protein
MKLLRRPANDLSSLFREGACFRASHCCEHLTVAVALNELHWKIEVQQISHCFTGHRARKHIAPDHDVIDFCLTNILEYSLKCGEIRMNIIDCSDPA